MNLRLRTGGTTLRVATTAERSIAAAARAAGVPLNMACGGRGVCGRCAVVLREGAFLSAGRLIEVAPGASAEALACATFARSDNALVEVPATSLIEPKAQVHEDFVLADFEPAPRTRRLTVELPPARLGAAPPLAERLSEALRPALGDARLRWPLSVLGATDPQAPNAGGPATIVAGPDGDGWTVCRIECGAPRLPHWGIAADIGTTTVVCALIDMDGGEVLGRASGYNQQIRRADDVAARISACETPGDVAELRRLAVEATLNPLIEELCHGAGGSPKTVVRLAAAGNTVMTHLLLGLSPAALGASPFAPVACRFPPLRAADLGLGIAPEAGVDIVPCMTGYLGGDIAADLLAARMMERRPPTLLIDIGTNGELVLWDGQRLLGSATAAGPAFEGAGVRHGCRAAAGAIDRIAWPRGGDLGFTVIGGGAPVGLCGSALVDFVARALERGLLNEVGRFDVEALRAAGRYAELPGADGAQRACIVARAEESGLAGPILVTERDLAELLKAKAALQAGARTLLARAGLEAGDLAELVLAGGFAHHLDLTAAIRIGLLPPLPVERIHVLGNGSLAGAYLALRKPDAFAAFDDLVRRLDAIELNLEPSFADAFVEGLMLDPGNAGV